MAIKRFLYGLLLVCGVLLSSQGAYAAQGENQAIILTAEGPVTPAFSGYISRGIKTADDINAEVILIELDTPGGSVDTTLKLVQDMRASDVPIVVYVSPNGATAGSAGLLITLAGHAAAMAPQTAIGASSPVGPRGGDLDTTIETKAKEIVAAEARSLAEGRGEAAIALANAAVFEAKAASASEAAEANLIDFIAADREELLGLLDGHTVTIQGDLRTLETANATITEIPPNMVEQALMFIINPNIVAALFIIGVAGIIAEIASPGGWAAGAVGVTCLGLALYGFGVLPINWLGVVFILMAFVLFAMELAVTGIGLLGAAGVVSLIVGLIVTFPNTNLAGYEQLSIPLIIGLSIASSGILGLYVRMIMKVRTAPAKTGQEALIGQNAKVVRPLNPDGMVLIQGERWRATLPDGQRADRNQSVIVERIDGMHLYVRMRQAE